MWRLLAESKWKLNSSSFGSRSNSALQMSTADTLKLVLLLDKIHLEAEAIFWCKYCLLRVLGYTWISEDPSTWSLYCSIEQYFDAILWIVYLKTLGYRYCIIYLHFYANTVLWECSDAILWIEYLKPLQHEADVVREDGKHVDHIEGSLQEGHLEQNSILFPANFVLLSEKGTFFGAQANRIRNSRRENFNARVSEYQYSKPKNCLRKINEFSYQVWRTPLWRGRSSSRQGFPGSGEDCEMLWNAFEIQFGIRMSISSTLQITCWSV